jgi:RND family efflux transporter MFP subunit
MTAGQTIQITPYFNQSIRCTGRVDEINPHVDNHGMIKIKAIIDNPKAKLYEGMNVKVHVHKKEEKALIIPKKAVTLRSERPVVFTYNDGLAKWNYVKTGLENQKRITIEKGIQQGDSVIVEGNENLGHNARVILQ